MKLFSSGRYAAVASTLALVVAVSGTSYAAVKITGASIQNNTVTTKDIKDKTLKVKDLSPGAKSKLKGAAGATGPAGPAGATGATGLPGANGAQGPIGPSNVYSVWNDNSTVLGGTKTVLSQTLQPGAYWVSSKVWAYSTSTVTPFMFCTLNAPTLASDQNGVDIPPTFTGTWGNLSNQIVITAAAPVTVTLACSGFNANAVWKKMTAIKVGSVTNVAGPNVAKPAQEPQAR
jgi:hypothetical protein